MRSLRMGFMLALVATPAAAQPPRRTADTTRVRFVRPVSPMVLETVRAAVAPARPQAAAAVVIARPAWSRQAVLSQRVRGVRPGATTRIPVRAVKVAPRASTAATTAREDSTIARQRASDFRVRADAVDRAAMVAPARLHPRIVANLISELDSVGAARLSRRGVPAALAADPGPENEAYSEYVVGLTRAVVRLRDPRSVRALAFGGLEVSREVQRFVAEQGRAGLAILDTAFAASDATGPAVVTTWAYALAGAPSRLSFADSVQVYARIVLGAQDYPVAFAQAARIAGLFDLGPELDSIAARARADSIPATAAAARVAARELTRVGAAAGAGDWLVRLRLRTGVLCMDATVLGAPRCRALLGATVAAGRAAGNLGAVRRAVAAYRTELAAAARSGALSAAMGDRFTPLLNGLLRASGDPQVP